MDAKIISSTIFGSASRYRLDVFHTRFGNAEYFILDAEVLDEETGLPSVIYQSDDGYAVTEVMENLRVKSEERESYFFREVV